MSDDIYDVLIIGGGPAGLSAAQYAARAKLRTLVLDKSSTAGALAFTGRIENYPGVEEPMSGVELRGRFLRQAERFGAEYRDETHVVGLNIAGDVKEAITMDGTFKARTIIIATGSMGRKASISGEAELLGRGVSYCAICDAAFYKGKTVCVLGDSEEAAKEAALLAKYAEKVYLISPQKKLKVPNDYPALEAANLQVMLGQRVTAIEGVDAVEKVRLKDHDGTESELQVHGVFVYLHGNKPVVDFLAGQIEADEEDALKVGSLMETSVPGVFAAGDVTAIEVRQVVVAAAAGCLAALEAEKYIFHRKKARSDWKH